jgi:hypothetical protein
MSADLRSILEGKKTITPPSDPFANRLVLPKSQTTPVMPENTSSSALVIKTAKGRDLRIDRFNN